MSLACLLAANTIVIRTEDSLETRVELAVYLVYVENRFILEPSTILGQGM